MPMGLITDYLPASKQVLIKPLDPKNLDAESFHLDPKNANLDFEPDANKVGKRVIYTQDSLQQGKKIDVNLYDDSARELLNEDGISVKSGVVFQDNGNGGFEAKPISYFDSQR